MARGSILKRRNKNGTTTFSIKYRTATVPRSRRPSARRASSPAALTGALAAVESVVSCRREQGDLRRGGERWLDAKRPLIEPSTYRDYEIQLAAAHAGVRPPKAAPDHAPADRGVPGRPRCGWRLSRKTINDSLIPLRQILGRAVRDGALPTNPAEALTATTR